MDSGDRILVAAGLTAAVVVGAFVFWGPGGAPRTRKRRGQIAGLQNLGRTCFLNTLLQALAASPVFIEWLRKYAKAGSESSMITTLYTVIEVVNGTHEAARGTPVCPLGVFNCLKALGWVVPEEQQDAHELLHVLLSCVEEEVVAASKKPGCLSDALGHAGVRAYSALASPASPPSPARAARSDSTPPTPAPPLALARPASAAPTHEPDIEDDDAPVLPLSRGGLQKGVSRSFCHLNAMGRRWGPALLPYRPPPPPPFHGTIATRLQCTVCSHKSPIRYDKYDSISLPMGNNPLRGGTYSLAGLLRAFTAPEIVRGVRCSKCAPAPPAGAVGGGTSGVNSAAYTQHIKTVSFGKLPSCLCLHVARLQWGETGLCKRSEFVSFPELLSLAPYASSQPPKLELDGGAGGAAALRGGWSALGAAAAAGAAGEPRALYTLQAAVVHVGGPRSGHFVTYRRGNGFEAKRWFYTSDTLVHEVTLQEVLRCSAYMLFYQRAPSAPGPLPPLTTAD